MISDGRWIDGHRRLAGHIQPQTTNPTARKNLTTVLNTSRTAMTVIIVHLAQTQTNLLALEWSVEFNISYE